jgi:hypothetical protein
MFKTTLAHFLVIALLAVFGPPAAPQPADAASTGSM